MKLIRDDYELKTSKKRHSLRDIVGNHSKKLLLYGTQNEKKWFQKELIMIQISSKIGKREDLRKDG